MIVLRWCLGLTAGILGVSFLALFLLGNAFRKSFGASENSPGIALLVLLAGAVLLAALRFPENRPLLHFAALVALSLTVLSVWVMIAESAPVLGFALFYLAAWFVFYGLTAWRPPALP